VRGALLVRGKIVMYPAAFVKRVVHVENGSARISENGIHALFQKTIDYNFRSCHFRFSLCFIFLSAAWGRKFYFFSPRLPSMKAFCRYRFFMG
jgi:hypothetical protein